MTSASRVQTVFVTALLVGLLACLAALAALGVLGAEVGGALVAAFVLAALVGLRGLRGEAVPAAPAPRAEAAPLRLLASSAEPHLLVAADGKVVDGNEAAAALVGVPHASLAGASFAGWFADPESAAVALERTRARGAIRGVALTLQRASGEARGLLFSGSLAPADDGTAPHALVGLRDVSESRSAAADAEKRLAYTRSLVEASADPLVVVDVDGTITDVTDAAIVRFGLPRERLVGSEFGALFADADAARRAHERTLAEGRVSDVVLTLRSRVAGLVEVMFSGRAYRDEGGVLRGVSAAIRDVTATRKAERDRDAKEWMVAGVGRLNEVFQGQVNTRDLTRRIISELAEYTGAQVGAFYAVDPDGEADALSLIASHAYTHRKTLATRFRPGEGVVGQAALEKKQILLSDVPEDYIRVASGLGEATPRHLCVTPLMLEGRVTGMLELASLGPFTDAALDYLRQVAPSVAVSLEAAVARERVGVALQRAQTLAAELEAQQDTLRNTNAELEEQTAQLKVSEQKLKSQQAEIELANTELTQKNDLLERQKVETEQARRVLAAQAVEVALASKYKSEFLANMSHELRTPLNSLLLLARSLRENATENLTAEQVESATVIYESGSDLLSLINEILDLSKIEAGKMELRLEAVELADLERSLLSQFAHMASAQGLKLVIERAPDAPAEIVSDAQRVGQVLKNLIGNALKFTEAGGVTVRIGRPDPDARLARSGLDPAASLAISVTDTGIGIPADKQRIIFEAFQQADSGDRRKYGGTGLGLSISRELAALLGGEIQLVSEPGKGSTFTVFLPLRVEGPVSISRGPARAPAPAPTLPRVDAFAAPQPAAPKPAPARQALPDDRASIAEHDHVILVVEDDERFARILAAHVRARGLKCLLATSGEEGLELARAHRPDGVVLDIQLPQMDGWAVLNTLKQDVSLRHIPVHIVSAEESSTQNLRLGAIGHVAKPVGREQIDEVLQRLEAASAQAPKRVLVVEDDDVMRRETVRIVGNGNVSVTEVSTGGAALAALAEGPFQLVVMDLGLPDMQGLELLRRITEAKLALPPVIIHTNRELTTEEELFLRAYAESIIVKDVRSQERLIDEVALFLHRVVRDLPEENRRAILHLHESNEPLRGKKVLIVEDDMRTMFAMARMLAGHGVNPVKAENGERALAMLGEHPDVDLVLMDMMMPVLDGYEAMQRIRKIGPFARLPIVALTAKAMKEDRQRCLEAGATDYLSKPVDPDRLVSLMRVLLSR
jgi:PAS domain S-box-containing protein